MGVVDTLLELVQRWQIICVIISGRKVGLIACSTIDMYHRYGTVEQNSLAWPDLFSAGVKVPYSPKSSWH